MTTSNQLLPCPFCGSSNIHMFVGVKAYEITCRGCDIRGPIYDNQDSAISGWNRRATQPAAGEPEQKTAINADDLPTKKYPLAAFDFAAPVAAGEPVAWIIESPEGCSPCKSINHLKHMAERYAAAGWSVTPLYAAPPAAAHGDEAVASAKQLAESLKLVRRWERPGQATEWEFEVPGSFNRHVVASSEQAARAKIAQDVRREAPPAAAHGDEAVRKDAERYQAIRNTPEIFIGVAEGDDMVFLKSPDQLDQLADNAAAMRAQAGEGGEA